MVRASEHRLLYLPIRMVQTQAPVRQFSPVGLQELAASIQQVGILQPLTVQRHGAQYLVVSGTRRLLAARMAGVDELPCLLLDDAQDPALIALTENLQREDLCYWDEAQLLQEYLRRSGLTQAEAAQRLGCSQSAIANKLRLLQHSPAVRQALRELGLNQRQARELLRLPSEESRLYALREISLLGLNVAQTQRYITAYLSNMAQPQSEKFRRHDAMVFLDRVKRDAAALDRRGVSTELRCQDQGDSILLTLRIDKATQ